MGKGKVIGVDLGTTNSCVAIVEGGEPQVITNSEGGRTTPSIVAFTKENERLVGQVAKRQAVTNPENTIFSVKRFMGRRFDEVKEEGSRVPYEVAKASNGDAVLKIRGSEHSPPEISARILQKMRQTAEDYLGQKVDQVVVTVPAYFNDSQRQATKDAGKVAGLDVLRIINEPTAAALAYGMDKKNEHTIAVYDLGGGTFDISILELGDGVYEVKATSGDTRLGGDDFDHVIIDWMAEEFKKEQGIDLREDRMALQRLKEEAEKAKCALSSSMAYNINLPFITADSSGPKHLNLELTRAKLEDLTTELVDRTLEPCQTVLKDAGLKPEQIDEVILVGGMTRMPAVQEAVKKLFKKEPNKSVNADEAVALGAAIQGAVLAGEVSDVLLLDVTPLSLGIETQGEIFTRLIEKNTTIPTRKSEIFSTASDNQTAVSIHVLQGERDIARHNRTLGRFDLVGIPPSLRGVPQVEVTFDIDANGIIHVSAKDLGTGKDQKIKIESSSGLSETEMERMIAEAEEHAEEDRTKKEEITLRNHADQQIYNVERMLRDLGDKVDAASKGEIEEAIQSVRSALKDDSGEEIKKACDALLQTSHRLSEQVYQQASQSQSAEEESESVGDQVSSDDVVDAEFEVGEDSRS